MPLLRTLWYLEQPIILLLRVTMTTCSNQFKYVFKNRIDNLRKRDKVEKCVQLDA